MSESTADSLRQLVTFRLGAEEFAIDILCVQEIIRVPHVTRVPGAAGCLEGVLNLRGRVIPVISLRRRLNLPEVQLSRTARVVVLDVGRASAGLLVDSVAEVLRVPEGRIEEAPDTGANSPWERCLAGVVKLDQRLLMLLDVTHLLAGVETPGLAA